VCRRATPSVVSRSVSTPRLSSWPDCAARDWCIEQYEQARPLTMEEVDERRGV
jgi:hypothetical protein